MLFFHNTLKSFHRICKCCSLNTLTGLLLRDNVRLCTTDAKALQKITIRSMRYPRKKYRSIIGWTLLVIPISSFGLGTWQVFRKFEKEAINEKFLECVKQPAVDFPKNLDELEAMEFRAVRVKGTFDHSKELYLGPRPPVTEDSFTKPTSLLSVSNAGFQVITPFKLSDRNLTIMVNRGWVPADKKLPKTREEGQITGEVELVGLVRKHENREALGARNLPEKGFWVYRDLYRMSEYNGAAPILIDAVKENNVPGGPLGGQTIIQLKNDHVSYIITWYSLCAVSSYLWYLRFFPKTPIIV